ncbi:MAG: hypothetical protein LBU48_03565 [Coriobacteriales bacterium]|jgi:hypothetical protein|nr:hypothetical protein [Coriobacteriales bacterium]
MKVLTVQGEELATIALKGGKGQPLTSTVKVPELGVQVTQQVEISTERCAEGLILHVRIPGTAKLDALLEPADVSALKGLMSGSMIKFFIGALLKG